MKYKIEFTEYGWKATNTKTGMWMEFGYEKPTQKEISNAFKRELGEE